MQGMRKHDPALCRVAREVRYLWKGGLFCAHCDGFVRQATAEERAGTSGVSK